jgi:hypothetical protein
VVGGGGGGWEGGVAGRLKGVSYEGVEIKFKSPTPLQEELGHNWFLASCGS